MIIGLMGFECDSPNKGCEALGYAFISLLRRIGGNNLTFYVFTNDGLGYFPTYFQDCRFVKVALKIKDPTLETWKGIRKCDMIFDVTLGDSFSDIYSVQQCLSNIKFKLMAEVLGKSYYLLPQTYGPFSDKRCRFFSKLIIKHSNYVFCRDRKSMEYLEMIGAHNDNLLVTTDMAFMLPYEKKLYDINNNKTNIGINISGLLMKGGFDKENQFDLKFKYEDYIVEILDFFTKCPDTEVHLIPHVIDLSLDSHDDDYKCLQEIQKNYKTVKIAPLFKTPIEAKSYISNMDFFIGSRMHSTIAAVSCCVPTVPVSYSRKFEGLFDSLNYPYVIHGNGDNLKEAISKTLDWYNNRDVLQKSVMKARRVIDIAINEFEAKLNKIID